MLPTPNTVLAVVTDLIFGTKIFSTAKSLQVPTLAARTLDSLRLHLAQNPHITLVLLDLNITAFDPLEALQIIRQLPSPPRLIAYVSHVQTDLITAAREAGADQILARSAFTEKLPALLQSA